MTLQPPNPNPTQVYDYDIGPTDELMGVMQLYLAEEVVETDRKTGGQRVVYKPRWVVRWGAEGGASWRSWAQAVETDRHGPPLCSTTSPNTQILTPNRTKPTAAKGSASPTL